MEHLFAFSVLTDPIHNFYKHWDDMLFGVFTTSIISHAVQKFPTSNNAYVNWLLGIVQFAVGQRERALNTLNGNATQTVTIKKD